MVGKYIEKLEVSISEALLIVKTVKTIGIMGLFKGFNNTTNISEVYI